MPHPTNNLQRVLELHLPCEPRAEPLWHLMWNHPSGPGAACEASSGCFTLAVESVTCPKCLEVNAKEQPCP